MTAFLRLIRQLARGLADDLQLALGCAAFQLTGVKVLPAGCDDLGEVASCIQDVLDGIVVALAHSVMASSSMP